jgi:hypothetical protein
VLLQLPFNLRNELFATTVDVVLGIEEGAAFGVALGFQGFDLLLPGELFFES